MKRVCMLTLCIVGMVLYSSMRTDRGITIFMVGDSTMANKDTSGGKQERGWGTEGSKRLHMWFAPGEHPSLPDGSQDNTHYNIYGARVKWSRVLSRKEAQRITQETVVNMK